MDIKEGFFYICAAAILIFVLCMIGGHFSDKTDLKQSYNEGYEEGYKDGYDDGVEWAKDNWAINE